METNMKNMDKISIIIPVYNVEPYIRKCLDSVVNQTYQNLEIICINDGSTDDSGKICDEYAAKDSRIRVFHKKNGGLSSALNVGLKNFTGDYLGFVDSDDWAESDMFEILHKSLKSSGAHISVAGYFKDTDTESIPMSNKERISDGIINTRNMLLYPLKRDYYMGFCGYAWNKLFLADIVRESGLLFENDIKYGMDVLFYTTIVLAGGCVGVYADKLLYHYYQRSNAISKLKSFNIKIDILTVYKRVEKLLIDGGYSDISYWARGFYCYHASVIAEMLQCEIKSHLNDYIEANKEFPEKIERMHGLLPH
jgi:glycosyltransferase involved in cell wall biosynthesis